MLLLGQEIGGDSMRISARKKYHVKLTGAEKEGLLQLIRKGHTQARVITRARVLLLADEGKTDKAIYQSLQLADSTPGDIRERFANGGTAYALYDKPRPGKRRKLTGAQEAEVVALACTDAPQGASRWTLSLLTEEVRQKLGVAIGRTAIWKVLLRNDIKPWHKKNLVYPAYHS